LSEEELNLVADLPGIFYLTSIKSSYLYDPYATNASYQIGFGNTLTKQQNKRLFCEVITIETFSLIS
jgi:hypothetical protein